MNIALILGTAREGNNSRLVFNMANNILEKEYLVTLVDIKDYLFGKTTIDISSNKKINEWKNIIDKNDICIFVCPEYNHSYPGELKILLDSLYTEYKGKKAGVIGVSSGKFGGVRVIEELKKLLHVINFDVLHQTIAISEVHKGIDRAYLSKSISSMVAEEKN